LEKSSFIIISVLFTFGCVTTAPKISELNNRQTLSITGVWKAEKFAFRYPDSAWTVQTPPDENLYIFTTKYYSYTYVRGNSPRKLFEGDPNKPTDAEKITAYDSFVANSGTYSVKDSILILRAVIHKNPNEMTGKHLTYKIKIERNKLQFTITDPPFLPGREWRTNLIRVE
jgi:Lipocalin-like domain